MERSEARAILLRRVISDVCGRSHHMIKDGTRLRADLDLRPSHEAEIARQVQAELAVAIGPDDWRGLSTVRDLIRLVEVEIARRSGEYAGGE